MFLLCTGVYPVFLHHIVPLPVAVPTRNALSVLMASRFEKHLPRKLTGDNLHGDQKLYNDLVASLNIGWTRDISIVGERCVKIIAQSLWYVDACHKQFEERSINFPEVFKKFQGYNNWRQKKIKKLMRG